MPDQNQIGDRPPQPRDTLGLLRSRPRQALAIGVVLALAAGAFAFVGGWLSPTRLTPERFVNHMEANAGGPHKGFRRAHAKGICVAGSFQATPEARTWSKAAVFSGAVIPVVGRFAEATPDPYKPDNSVPVRSMALELRPPGGGEWRTGNNNTPGLHVSTPEAFNAFQIASTPDPATGKPDPAKMKAFLDAHPETVAFNARMAAKPLAADFGNDTYNSVDGFYYVAPDGTRRLVRWRFAPEAPFTSLAKAELARRPKNYLFDNLLQKIGKGPLKWRLVATFAQPGDPNRAAELWPENRKQAVMGELTLTHAESEAPGNCRDLNFDPMTLPPGIEPSDDPIPWARSAVYAESFHRRMSEPKPPSAVADAAVGAPP
jgi:catalase